MSMEHTPDKRVNDPDKAQEIAHLTKPLRDEAAVKRQMAKEYGALDPSEYSESYDKRADRLEKFAEKLVDLTDDQLEERYNSLDKESVENAEKREELRGKIAVLNRELEQLRWQSDSFNTEMDVAATILEIRKH